MAKTLQEAEAALNHPQFSHTRAGDRLYRGTVLVYHRADSPSGVLLHSVIDEALFDQCKRPPGSAPLSPTESR